MNYLIGVCTARRPAMLKKCLESLVSQKKPLDGTLQVVVVENDDQPNSQNVVAEVTTSTDVKIHYCLETERGIPFARNRVLAEAIRLGVDNLALIDDDEVADQNWLFNLSEAKKTHSADVVNGPVRRVFNVGAQVPKWWNPMKPVTLQTGSHLSSAPTNNVLLSARLYQKSGFDLKFDTRLTFGHEDIDFFSRAVDRGAKIVWCSDAWVTEEIPASRVENHRLLERAEADHAARAYLCSLREGRMKALTRFAPKGFRRLVMGSTLVMISTVFNLFRLDRKKTIFFKGLLYFYRGKGSIRGIFYKLPQYYGNIDGH